MREEAGDADPEVFRFLRREGGVKAVALHAQLLRHLGPHRLGVHPQGVVGDLGLTVSLEGNREVELHREISTNLLQIQKFGRILRTPGSLGVTQAQSKLAPPELQQEGETLSVVLLLVSQEADVADVADLAGPTVLQSSCVSLPPPPGT